MNFEPAIALERSGSYTIHFSQPNPKNLFIDQVNFLNGENQVVLGLKLLDSEMDGQYKAFGNVEDYRRMLRALNLEPVGGTNDEFRFVNSELFAIRLAQISYLSHRICSERVVGEQNEQQMIQAFESLRAHAESCDMVTLASSYKNYLKCYLDTPDDKIHSQFLVYVQGFPNSDSGYYKWNISSFANKILVNLSDDCRISPERIHDMINKILAQDDVKN